MVTVIFCWLSKHERLLVGRVSILVPRQKEGDSQTLKSHLVEERGAPTWTAVLVLFSSADC